MNTQINITENGKTTLDTAGKYCDRNIDVNVSVSGVHTSCFDGTFEGEFIDNDITSVRYGAFAECTEITKLSLPNCTNVGGNYAFYTMTNVKEILLPSVTGSVFGATFYQCGNLETIDMRSLSNGAFDSNCFRNCSKLTTLILGGDANTICTIKGSNVFQNANAVNIYVPNVAVEKYKGDSTWASLTSRIKPMSELEE